MKFQYLIEIAFIQLTLKTSLSPNLKLSLFSQKKDQEAKIHPGCSVQLQCRRLQRKFDLSGLQPFKLVLEAETTVSETYFLQLTDQQNAGKLNQPIQIPLQSLVSDFEKNGKICLEENWQGKLINLQYKITITKKDHEKIENIALNIFNPNGEQQEMRNSSRHSKRPPELNIQTKNKLRASTVFDENEKAKSQRIQRDQQDNISHKKKQVKFEESGESKVKEPVNWQIFSALPNISALFKRKSKREKDEQPEIQQVKELLMSHHPMEDHHEVTTKLSLKLKIVIFLLILGVFFLIADMFKNKEKSRKSQEKGHSHSSKPKHSDKTSQKSKTKGKESIAKKSKH